MSTLKVYVISEDLNVNSFNITQFEPLNNQLNSINDMVYQKGFVASSG